MALRGIEPGQLSGIRHQIGRAILLSSLAAFYDEHQGQAAAVDPLVESLGADSVLKGAAEALSRDRF